MTIDHDHDQLQLKESNNFLKKRVMVWVIGQDDLNIGRFDVVYNAR